MNGKIQTAIASFGMSGQVFHGPFLKVIPGFEVAKILERTKNNSKEMFPDTEIVRSYEKILHDKSIELVVVNTPDIFHYEMAKEALEAGKHVVVEKPFTQSSEQAKELIEIANKKGVLLTVFQNRRWDGDFMTVQKVVKEKMIGRLIEFESHYDRYRNFIVPDTWKENGGEKGGVLFNLGSHMIDQALILFGKPKTITAHVNTYREGGKIPDNYNIHFWYENYSVILRSSLLVREQGPRYIIHGTDGSFLKWGIDPQEEALKAGALPVGENWGKEPESNWGLLNSEAGGIHKKKKIETMPGDYKLFYQNVHDAIRKGEELAVKPEEALLVIEMVEACLKSQNEKRTILL